jgi:hypothetical protein
MSLIAEAQRFLLTKIRGMASLPDQFDRSGLDEFAELAHNVEIQLNQQVQTRRGFGSAWNPNKSVTAMMNWILAASNRLAYYNKTDGKVTLRNLAAGTEVDLLTGSAAETADFASLGARLLFAQITSAGAGAAQARIWDGVTAPASADKAFEPPMVSTAMSFTTAEPAAGTVSKGAHRLAVVFTTRTGYETRPCPVTAGFGSSGSIADLVYGSVTASGNKTLRVTITPGTTWPASFVSAALLMTTVQNTARYFFVPGCTASVTGGGAGAVTFPDVNLNDTILGSSSSVEAVTATKNYFGLYSQDSSAAGPFSPFKVLGYSDRAVYLVTLSDGTSGAFVSNKNAPQWITLANHLIQLEEKRQITTGFVLRGSLYLVGPGWTYACSDNTSLPVSWAPPQQVDGRIGTPSVFGVSANTSLGYAFVAATDGLYLFEGGAYGTLPISYLNSADYARINWAAPQGTIQVLDFPAAKMVLVKAPLDAAVAANKILAFDYSMGKTWDRVNYCGLWDSSAFLDIGALANVWNPTAKVFEVYLSRYSAGKVLRSKSTAAGDASIYNDDSAGYTSQYRSAGLPPASPEPRQIVGFRPRITGNGSIIPTVYTFDNTRNHVLATITASTAPGRFPLVLCDVQSEAAFLELSNNGVADAWFKCAGVEAFYQDEWTVQR